MAEREYTVWPRWMDRATAARYLDYGSVEIIQKLEQAGLIKGRNPSGGDKRYDREELDRAFERVGQ